MQEIFRSVILEIKNKNEQGEKIMNKLRNKGILPTVGNTPLIKLEKFSDDFGFNIYAKMESQNPSGSIKDRTALAILSKAVENGEVQADTTIIESSSGNMAIGLAQICKYYGLKLIVVVDPNINKRNLEILETYGVEISLVKTPHPLEGFLGARLERVNSLLKSTPNSYWTNQYGNPENVITHRQTMKEIADDLGGDLDYMFVATSTCGTIMGCAEYASSANLKTKLIAVDAVGSVLFGDSPKKRLIPGHGAGRKSQFLNENLIHKAVHISDLESVKGCRKLLDVEAILAGGSTGAAISAIEKMKEEIPIGSNIAFFVCDRGERYLETIYNNEWVYKNLGVNLLRNLHSTLKLAA